MCFNNIEISHDVSFSGEQDNPLAHHPPLEPHFHHFSIIFSPITRCLWNGKPGRRHWKACVCGKHCGENNQGQKGCGKLTIDLEGKVNLVPRLPADEQAVIERTAAMDCFG